MRRVHVLTTAFTALMLASSAPPARADVITVRFRFLASGFGVDAPVDPVVGKVSVTFDNSLNLMEQTKGLTVSGLNIALDSGPAFAYGAAADVLILGGLTNGAQTLAGGTNDFLFGILNASTHPTPACCFTYSQTAGLGVFSAPAVLMPAPVPEPTTLALLGLGAAVVGGAGLRRRGDKRQ